MGIKNLSEGVSLEDLYKKRRDFSVTIEGKRYSSIKEYCLVSGISYRKTLTRLSRGWSLDKAVSKVSYTSKEVSLNGVLYASLYQCVSNVDAVVSYSTVLRRLQKGFTLEEALFYPRCEERVTNEKEVFLEGVKYSSVTEALRSRGLAQTTVFQRRKKGYSKKDAYSQHSFAKVYGDTIFFEGKKYVSLHDACQKLKISYHKVLSLIKEYDLPIEEVLAKARYKDNLVD